MISASATPYSSLPNMPQINAMPDGIPYGPWGQLYRAAPGAQIPAVRYPTMMTAMAGAGLGAPVTIVGSRLGATATTKKELFVALLIASVLAAGTGAGYALTRQSRRPVLYPALFMGGVTLGSGLLSMILASNGNGAGA